jgi:hypothetical protein
MQQTTVRRFTKFDTGELGWRSYQIDWGASGPEESDDLKELKAYLEEYEFDLGCGDDECCAIHTWQDLEKLRGVCRQCGSREFVVADIASGLQRLREVVDEWKRRNSGSSNDAEE